jgi:hypothetical protein
MKLIKHLNIDKEFRHLETIYFKPDEMCAMFIGTKDLAVTILLKSREFGASAWFKTEKERDAYAASLKKQIEKAK